MKKICLITTGGTIASRRNTADGHVTAQVGGASLRATLPNRPENIDVFVDDFMTIGSFALTLDDAFRLAFRIRKWLSQSDVDGVVVTHGTDTMEESAYMAELLNDSDKPVVFTGAQRSADEPNSDGPRNLADAIAIAACEETRGLGVLLSFEQEFHAARDVTKSHTSRVDTFVSGEHGKLGEIDGETVIVHRRPAIRSTIATTRIESDIEIVKLGIGNSDRYLRFLEKEGVKAVILEGFGRGNATPPVTEAAIALVKKGVPVVITSRCQRGRVKPIYGNGGGKTLAEGGIVFAGDLSAQKARVLLSVLVGADLPFNLLKERIEYFAG